MSATNNSKELADQISQWSARIGERQLQLEAEAQQWKSFKEDYDALENQLKTFPDETTRSAMIPMGKLAFMPGKFIHTNEIMVLLGDQYYVERSAKQAISIVRRRKEAVEENYRLIEAQLNAIKSKSDSNIGVFPSDTNELNEEGLPIMEIREELPPKEDKPKPKVDKGKGKAIMHSTPASDPAPANVASTPNNSNRVNDDEENKALFEMLRKLEEEEEEELAKEKTPDQINQEILREEKIAKQKEKQEKEDEEDWDNYYDTEVADSMFDHFDDDEEYGIEGVVDHENFTYHDDPKAIFPEDLEEETQAELADSLHVLEDIPEEQTPEKNAENEREMEESTSIKNVVERSPVEKQAILEQPAAAPKKLSKFKLARQQRLDESKEGRILNEDEGLESTPVVATSSKKPSKFKLAQQKGRKNNAPKEPSTKSDTPPVIKTQSKPIQKQQNIPKRIVQEENEDDEDDEEIALEMRMQMAAREHQDEQDEKEYLMKKRAELEVKRHIPAVVPAKGKKLSKFKLARQQERDSTPKTALDSAPTPVSLHVSNSGNVPEPNPAVERASKEVPKRKVTWDDVTTVHEHAREDSPSTRMGEGYTEPVKKGQSQDAFKPRQNIRSPADIFNVIRQTQAALVPIDEDGYPVLENEAENIDENEAKVLDIQDLINSVRSTSQVLWRPASVGNEEAIPFIPSTDEPMELSKAEQEPIGRPSKMDTNTMRGAVMERDTEPVDMDELEEDMEIREITTSYHRKRQEMMAAMGNLSFESKPEFEVIDEELPTPHGTKEKETKAAPKKMSRFKAARLGLDNE
ncbi:hypothetical protein J3Q64DRAFT_1836086 [Phycomyces blakesleeanus]|uniref:DUF3835 domain-containing protein n=1 Tax=Phycomyces blakesleeanus TaxID=4837 RepID=A0ABR3AVJ4_PHYBL